MRTKQLGDEVTRHDSQSRKMTVVIVGDLTCLVGLEIVEEQQLEEGVSLPAVS